MNLPTIEEVKVKLYGKKEAFFTEDYCDTFDNSMLAVMVNKVTEDEDEQVEFVLSITNPIQRLIVRSGTPGEDEGVIGCFEFSKVPHMLEIYNSHMKTMVRLCLVPNEDAVVVSYLSDVFVNKKTGHIRSSFFEQANYYQDHRSLFQYGTLAMIQHFLENEEVPTRGYAPALH